MKAIAYSVPGTPELPIDASTISRGIECNGHMTGSILAETLSRPAVTQRMDKLREEWEDLQNETIH